jgi:hypothetical protein
MLLQGKKEWSIKGYKVFLQHPADIVYIPAEFDHSIKNLAVANIAWTFQFHENHFGTKVGIPETMRLLDT